MDFPALRGGGGDGQRDGGIVGARRGRVRTGDAELLVHGRRRRLARRVARPRAGELRVSSGRIDQDECEREDELLHSNRDSSRSSRILAATKPPLQSCASLYVQGLFGSST